VQSHSAARKVRRIRRARRRYAYCGDATTEEVGVIGDIVVELVTVPPSPSGSGDIDQELATIIGLATVEDVRAGAGAV